ncbi:MAG: FHA domain-containing protein [Chloroflexi bacterium]|nr:FHA domain-containing protein [Chloroflexota bacterium]
MAAPNYQLVMRSGPAQGKVFPLEKEELFIGRDLANDIVINDPEVSRRHSRLVSQAGGYVLEDMGSTNGTFVNGQRLSGPYILQPTEIITLGEHVTLAYEAVVVDADATLVSPAARDTIPQPMTPPVTPPPAAFQPAPTPIPPQPSFSGQVPPGPVIAVEPPPPAKKKGSRLWLILLILVVLFLVCACVGVFYYIDTNSLWCSVLPFIPGCP